MSLLIALLIGVGMGVATGFWFRRNADYLLIDTISGVAGAIIGLAVYFFAWNGNIFSLVSVGALLSEVLGAAVLLLFYQLAIALPKKKKGKQTIEGPAQEEE